MKFIELIDEYREDIINSTREIIRIRSVEEAPKENMPFGEGPYRALKYALDLCEEIGMETKNFDSYAGHADYGDGYETVGILVHLDVVPEGDGWDFDPYGGEISDNKLYGRGTIDDKGPAIASIYAVKALIDSGEKLNKKIRIIFGTNEESGWGCMKHYFKHEKAPDMAFVPDADFPVINGEKGILIFDIEGDLEKNKEIEIISLEGGNVPNMVADRASAVIRPKNLDSLITLLEKNKNENISWERQEGQLILLAKGKSAHGSTPENGLNAISLLMEYMEDLYEDRENIPKFIKEYNEKIGYYLNGEKIGCGFEDDVSGKLNFNVGLMKSQDASVKFTVNIRYPIKVDSSKVYEGIGENLKDSSLKLIRGEMDAKPLYVPEDHKLVKTLMEVYRQESKDLDSKPIRIGGGTYARAMKNAVAFGPMFPGDEDVVHQKNEYIELDKLIKISKIYTRALYELCK